MMLPRTVLMTADTVGGVFTYAIELALALARREVRVVLALMGGPPTPAQREAAARVPGISVHESGYRLEWMEDPWEDVARAGRWLLDLEERTRADMIHLNGYAHGALPFRAPKLVVAHSCVMSWFEAVHGVPAPPRWDRYRREVAAGIAGADAVVAPTRAMLDALGRHHGAPARGRVIPNGRDADRFCPGTKENFILTLGRLWDPAKNIAALSAAARSLPWPVRAGGSIEAPDGARRTLPDLDPIGVLSEVEVARALSRASIYAAPARYEPFGLSILEAALSGCALVLGDIPSLRELWGGAALFIDPGDPRDLARALTCLAQSPTVRRALGGRARLRALDYSADRMAVGYLALYGELCTPGPRTTPPRRTPSAAPPRS